MIVASKDLALDAQKRHYTVPAINTQAGNYDMIRAIVEAAEETRSPVMLAMYVANTHYYGMEWFAEVSRWLGERVSVPVVIHHSTSAGAIPNAFPIASSIASMKSPNRYS